MRLLLLLFFALFISGLYAQESRLDQKTNNKIDSLDKRISHLESQMPKLSERRDAKYFSTKRELEMTVFLRDYESLLFDEDLEKAESLIESKLKASEKRMDQYSIDYYKKKNLEHTIIRGQQQARYQQLFEKEKNFKTEWEKFIKIGDEYSLTRALRMIDLSIKYASEKNLQETLKYLRKYKRQTEMLIFDLNNQNDLKKLTSSQSTFMNFFEPMIDSDSLETIKKAIQLVSDCYLYSSGTNAAVDTIFLAKQKIAAANAVADWNARQGISADLATLTGKAVTLQLDSINHEGIYIWKGNIVVIGSLNFNSKSDNVRKGEAIIDADRRIMDYVRINKIASVSTKAKIGNTGLLPYVIDGKPVFFVYDKKTQKWQYMIYYSFIINDQVTNQLKSFLPPMQFKDHVKQD
jgi:hypothetical protein